MTAELTFDFTPAQATAIRAYPRDCPTYRDWGCRCTTECLRTGEPICSGDEGRER
jgi:hypothetical protein